MMMIWEMMKAQLQSQKGQGMVEYGLILALVSVIALVALTSVGTSIGTAFTTVTTALTTAIH